MVLNKQKKKPFRFLKFLLGMQKFAFVLSTFSYAVFSITEICHGSSYSFPPKSPREHIKTSPANIQYSSRTHQIKLNFYQQTNLKKDKKRVIDKIGPLLTKVN